MKEFETTKAAYDYAETLGKYDWEICYIKNRNTKAFLCSTDLPLEEFFRGKLERMIGEFLKETGIETPEDEIWRFGAIADERMESLVSSFFDIEIICAGLEY